MKIEIHNITDGAVVSHPLLLVKGRVSPFANDSEGKSSEISLFVSGIQRSTKLTKIGRFKTIVHLNEGSNCISLHYGRISRTVRVCLQLPTVNERKNRFRLVYIVCRDSDGKFQAQNDKADNTEFSAVKRISVVGALLQCFIAESFAEHGLERKTIAFNEYDELPRCLVFKSSLSEGVARSMDSQQLWSTHAKELLESGVADKDTKVIAIMAATKYFYIDFIPVIPYNLTGQMIFICFQVREHKEK